MSALPLVLVPGSLCNERLYSPQLKYFGDIAVVADVCAEDSIEKLAEKVLASAPNYFALAGLSMGGIIAMEMMRQAPERIDRLALLNTNHRAETQAKASLRRKQVASVRNESDLIELVEQQLFSKYVDKSRYTDDGLRDTVLTMAAESGVAVFRQQYSALLNRSDSRNSLGKIECPTLIVCGKTDQLCSCRDHRDMQRLISHSQLIELAGCGHLSTLEKPKEVNLALETWLRDKR